MSSQVHVALYFPRIQTGERCLHSHETIPQVVTFECNKRTLSVGNNFFRSHMRFQLIVHIYVSVRLQLPTVPLSQCAGHQQNPFVVRVYTISAF